MPEIKKLSIAANQYYQVAHPKKYIFCHHTAGGSAASSIAHWESKPDHIATAFVIDRDGTIYQTFDEKYWSYHLGVSGNSAIEKASIGIEICSYGSLATARVDLPGKFKKGEIVTYTDKVMPPEKVIILPPFRTSVNPFAKKPNASDYTYTGTLWEAYTAPQIASLKSLLPYLLDKFKIKMQPDRTEFWNFRNPANLPPGVWSHSTVRQDKIDIFPQPSLVEVVSQL